MENAKTKVKNIFFRFLDSGDLPNEMPRELMGFDYGDNEWNSAVHYLTHVITDKDIRFDNVELVRIMKDELRRLILEIGDL